jgi:hypothetical protein
MGLASQKKGSDYQKMSLDGNLHPASPSPRSHLWLALLFFFVVVSVRLGILHWFGVDSPYSDQWGEVWSWLRPFSDGHTDWSMLIAPHNEHRIMWVRLVALALFILNNRQWDNLVAAGLDAFLVAALSSLAFLAMLPRVSRMQWPVLGLFLFSCCVPCGYENTLLGFQLQFYLLIALAVYGIWRAAAYPTDWRNTLVVSAVAFAGLFSMASGLLAPVAIAIAAALRLRATNGSWVRAIPLFASLAAAVLLGYSLLVTIPSNAFLKARDLGQWLDAMTLIGGWPLPKSPLSLIVVWAPTAAAIGALARRRESDPVFIAALAIALWVAAQVGTIAYGRGNDMGLTVHSRYTDVLALGVLANAYFCLHLAQLAWTRSRPATRLSAASVWLAVVVVGYSLQAAVGAAGLKYFSESRQLQARNIRDFVRGNELAIDRAQLWNIPLPDKRKLKQMLKDPTVLAMMPLGVRLPLAAGAYSPGFGAAAIPATLERPYNTQVFGSNWPSEGAAYTAETRSDFVHSDFPYLVFSVAGDLGAPDLHLTLQDTQGHNVSAISPLVQPGDTWSQVTVTTPADEFRIMAIDHSHEAWFAFTPPIEIGRLSRMIHLLLGLSPLLMGTSLVVLISILLVPWLRYAYHEEQRDPDGNRDSTDSGSPATADKPMTISS